MLRAFVRLMLLSLLLVLPAVEAGAQSGSSSLNPGDQLKISVWRNATMSCDCTVGANGALVHPLYREVQVVGVSLGTVEERLRTFLTRYETNPVFVVQPLVRVVVGGEVRNPNILSIPPETTVGQVVALAGGPTERGRLDKVQILRDGQLIAVDLSRPDSDVGALQIRSGDQILVGRRGTPAREYIGPITSTIAAMAGIASLLLR